VVAVQSGSVGIEDIWELYALGIPAAFTIWHHSNTRARIRSFINHNSIQWGTQQLTVTVSNVIKNHSRSISNNQ
jgi:hypothetical protein